MNSWRIAACVAALSLGGLAAAAPTQVEDNRQAEVLLQEAKHRALVDGDLERAIELCKKIVAEHGGNRAVAAKALVQMARCYEKLGRTEAQKTYSRVLNEFADQSESVAQARARLAILDSRHDVPQTGMVTQELKISYSHSDDLSQSRDGSKLLYTSHPNGQENVMMRDLATGQETQITHYTTEDGFTRKPVFSPDASQIAYLEAGKDSYLHIVSLKTDEDRRLVKDNAPLDWSSDGRFILLGWTPARNRMVYSVLSLDSVEVKKLKLELRLDRSDCRFSPDAQYVSYSDNGSLYLYHIDTDKVIQLTDRSHKDKQPLWCPDGKTILFLSQRAFGPEQDLCTLPVVNGKVTGDAQVVIPDFGEQIKLRSLNQSGGLLYVQTHWDKYIYSITVDRRTGEPLGKVKRMVGGTHPVWSPDGKRIAYIANNVLHLMSADGQEDREIMRVGFHLSGSYSWAADNDTIYMPELQKGRVVISAISISAKEKKTIWPGDGWTDGMHVTCSPDGKRLAFSKPPKRDEKYEIYVLDVNGTNLRQITFAEKHNAFYPAWSPDGKQIAFMSKAGDVSTLVAVSVADGTITEIFRGSTKDDRFFHKSWSPDGSKIVWGTSGNLHVGDVAEGTYHSLNLNVVSPLAPSWSPDGTRILFTGSLVVRAMLMEDFLPETNGTK